MKFPIRILYTIPNFITAGSGRAMLNIIQGLDREKFAPAVCVIRKGGKLDQEIQQMGIPFLESPFAISPRPYHLLLPRAWKAAQIFRPFHFSIWHSFHYSSDYTEPIIARLAGAKYWVYTKKNMGWGTRAWLLRSILADRIAIQNTAMTTLFFSKMRSKIIYIPPGVDTEIFRPGPPDIQLRQTWGFSQDTCVVAHVAHFVPVKNHPFLLHALAHTKENIALVLAGKVLDEKYFREIQSLVQELALSNRVRFLGNVENISNLLRSVDIFAFCSHQEGCPVAVLEAMASALPCVVSDIPAMRDIHKDGETGIIVPRGNAQLFANALDMLAQHADQRFQLGSCARKRVEERFSIRREIANYEQLYLELAAHLCRYKTL